MAILKTPKQFSPDFRLPGVKPRGAVEVDWDNPLTRGMMTATDCAAVNDLIRSDASAPNGVEPLGTTQGLSADFSSGTNYVSVASEGPLSEAVSDQTLLLVSIAWTGTDNLVITEKGVNDFLISQTWTDGTLLFNGTTASSAARTSVALNDGVQRNVCCTYNSTSGDHSFYIDGGFDSTSTTASGGNAATNNPFHIGSRSGSFGFNGSVAFVFTWNRVLSDAEAESITRNPYQILKPINEPYYFTAGDAAGGPVTGNVDQALETDESLSIVPQQDIVGAVGLSTEIDSAFDVTPVKDIIVSLGLSEETDEAFDVERLSLTDINTADEIDSAFDITPVKDIYVDVTISEETDSAFDIIAVKTILVSIGQSEETDSAFNIFAISEIGQGQETDSALDVTPKLSGPITVQVEIASELDRALALVGQDANQNAIVQQIISNIIYPIIP